MLAVQMARCFGQSARLARHAGSHACEVHTCSSQGRRPSGTSCSFKHAVLAAIQEVRGCCSHLARCEHSPRCSQQLRVFHICAEDVATADAAKKCQQIAGASYAVRQSLQTDKRAVKSIHPRQSRTPPALDTAGSRARRGSEGWQCQAGVYSTL